MQYESLCGILLGSNVRMNGNCSIKVSQFNTSLLLTHLKARTFAGVESTNVVVFPLDSTNKFTIGSQEEQAIDRDLATSCEAIVSLTEMEQLSHHSNGKLPSNRAGGGLPSKQDRIGQLSSSSRDESSNDIPVFVTCDKCHLLQ